MQRPGSSFATPREKKRVEERGRQRGREGGRGRATGSEGRVSGEHHEM